MFRTIVQMLEHLVVKIFLQLFWHLTFLFVQRFWIMLCKHLNLNHQKMITFGVKKKTKKFLIFSGKKISCDLTNFHNFISWKVFHNIDGLSFWHTMDKLLFFLFLFIIKFHAEQFYIISTPNVIFTEHLKIDCGSAF